MDQFAHDLKQSLSLLAGYAELALLELEEPQADLAEVHRDLQLMKDAAREAKTAVSQLLSSARPRT